MKFPAANRKTGLAGCLLAALLVLTSCGDDMLSSDLRLIHASKDAPPVNLRVGNKNLITDLDYAASSGYVELRSGTRRLAVEAIIPGGNADVIKIERFEFEGTRRYNLLAINQTADIAPLLVEESAAEPGGDELAIAVVHASTGVGRVDVYVTAADTPLDDRTEPSISFDDGDVVDAGALPAAEYRIRITAPGGKQPVYDSGKVDLAGFGGSKLLLAALDAENETELAAAPIKLLAAADETQLTLLDADTDAGKRLLHLSPDAGTAAGGAVEVFVTSPVLGDDPFELIDALADNDLVPAPDTDKTTPMLDRIPAGSYVFDIARNTDTIGDSVFTSTELPLAAGLEYSLIAAGKIGGAPDFALLATVDSNRPVITQASLKLVHAAPRAGEVDVYVTSSANDFSVNDLLTGLAGKPLLQDFAFGAIAPYVPLLPGRYDIRVIAGGAAAIDIEDFDLAPGLVGTLVARQPDGDGDPAGFGLVFLSNQAPVIETPPYGEADEAAGGA